MRVIWAAVAVVGALLTAAGASAGAGGTSIASAPEVPLNHHVVSSTHNIVKSYICGNGGSSAEFWRVTLGASDRLTVDYGTTTKHEVILAVLPPKTTDSALSETKCFAYEYTNAKAEIRFSAPFAGRWILALENGSSTLGYAMTVRVSHFTHATLAGPRLAHPNSRVELQGAVAGVTSGSVVLQEKAGSRWKTLGTAPIGANGRFAFITRVGVRGSYRVRAVYSGDTSHLRASATFLLRVD